MSDAQTWTIVGGTLGLMAFGFTAMTLCFTWLKGSVDAGLSALRSNLSGEIRTLDARLGGRIDTLSVRVDGLTQRVESVERRMEIRGEPTSPAT